MKVTIDELRQLKPQQRESLPALYLEHRDGSQNADMSCLFAHLSALQQLDLSGLSTANVTDMSYMFWRSRRLTWLDLARFDTAEVVNMEGMFSGCNALMLVNLSGFDTAKVKSMAKMFAHCCLLEKLDLSGFDTAKVENMSQMFRYCCELTSLDLSGFNFTNVTNMADIFDGCSNLQEVLLSDTLLRAKCLVKRVINKNKLPKGAFIDEHGNPCYYGYGNAGPYSAYEDRIHVPLSQLQYEDFGFDKTTKAEWRAYLGLTEKTKLKIVPHKE